MTYDPMAIQAAALRHAQAAQAHVVTLDEAAAQMRALAREAQMFGDPIATALIECAELFEGGDFCSVILTGLGVAAAVDDGAVPNWTQTEGQMLVYREADARAKATADAAEMRRRYPGFPKSRQP